MTPQGELLDKLRRCENRIALAESMAANAKAEYVEEHRKFNQNQTVLAVGRTLAVHNCIFLAPRSAATNITGIHYSLRRIGPQGESREFAFDGRWIHEDEIEAI